MKQGDALSPLLFSFALEYAITKVQGNQKRLELNETLQILAFADGVNILSENINVTKENHRSSFRC
jgi:hypothetical protein